MPERGPSRGPRNARAFCAWRGADRRHRASDEPHPDVRTLGSRSQGQPASL